MVSFSQFNFENFRRQNYKCTLCTQCNICIKVHYADYPKPIILKFNFFLYNNNRRDNIFENLRVLLYPIYVCARGGGSINLKN